MMYYFNEVVLISTFFRHYKGIKIFITSAYLCNEASGFRISQLRNCNKSETMVPIKAGHGWHIYRLLLPDKNIISTNEFQVKK